MEEKSIQVQIGSKSYAISVLQDEEATVMAMANAINQKINVMKSSYGITDKVDLLAMAALEHCIELSKKNNSEVSIEGLEEKLTFMHQRLTEVLS